MKRLLFLIPLFFVCEVYADTRTAQEPFLCIIATNVVDRNRSYGDKLNDNNEIVSATISKILNGQIGASSYTLQGNSVNISTVASFVNSVLNPSSATLQGNRVDISTTAQGVNALNQGQVNASSYTLQGNSVNISTVAQGLNLLSQGLINASSYTLQGNRVNISTVATGLNYLIQRVEIVAASTGVIVSSAGLYHQKVSSLCIVVGDGPSRVVIGASSWTLYVTSATGSGGSGGFSNPALQTLDMNGFAVAAATRVEVAAQITSGHGLRIYNKTSDTSVRSSSTIEFVVRNSVGMIQSAIGGGEGSNDDANAKLYFYASNGTNSQPAYRMVMAAEGLAICPADQTTVGPSSPYELDVLGDIRATGSVDKAGGSFLIPHPNPDRKDKWLKHGYVESDKLGLIYDGEAKLVDGVATVTMPDWFEYTVSTIGRTVNLTCKNGYSPLFIDGNVQDGKFTVKTDNGKKDQEFYWQVNGQRGDPYVMSLENDSTDELGRLIIEPSMDDEIITEMLASGKSFTTDDVVAERNKRRAKYKGYR